MNRKFITGLILLFAFVFSFALAFAGLAPPEPYPLPPDPGGGPGDYDCCTYSVCGSIAYGVWINDRCTCSGFPNPNGCPLYCVNCP